VGFSGLQKIIPAIENLPDVASPRFQADFFALGEFSQIISCLNP
jgi:hypothetical protein